MSRLQVSVLISTSNRPQVLSNCLSSILSQSYDNIEILIFDNSSEINSCDRLNDSLCDPRVQCTHTDETYGVAGSRNWLMKQANGDIFVVLDDDAEFQSDDALNRIVSGFKDNIGIQALKIVDHPDSNTERILAPISQSQTNNVDLNEPFQTSYYVGGGHAIKREVIEQCGYYNEDLVYGHEELDLSYRAIEAGFSIIYNPKIVVHHYPEPPIIDIETVGKPEFYYELRNRLYIAYRYLPLKYLPSYLSVWILYYASVAAKSASPIEFVRAIADGLKLCSEASRSPISSPTEQYLKRNYGRLWY